MVTNNTLVVVREHEILKIFESSINNTMDVSLRMSLNSPRSSITTLITIYYCKPSKLKNRN